MSSTTPHINVTARRNWTGDTIIALVTREGTLPPYLPPGLEVPKQAGDMNFARSGDEGRHCAVVVSLGKQDKATDDTVRRAGGTIAKWLRKHKIATAGIDCSTLTAAGIDNAVTAVIEGLLLGSFTFNRHKSKRDDAPQSQTVTLICERASQVGPIQKKLDRTRIIAEAVNLTREVSHEPPNEINPVSLAKLVQQIARKLGLRCKVLDETQIEARGMGALLAVGKASETPSRLIIIEHRGRKKNAKPIVLVGKAITFDTGGYSIKPRDGIIGMKYDKCGGMAVLGALVAAARLELPVPIVGIISAAENMVAGNAYRPDDIIKTMSGKTVEIVSADAEGRLVLADALTYAQKNYNPRCIIDLATLTGGVVIALGKAVAGLFSTDQRLQDRLMASGDLVHERLWPLPLYDDYFDLIKGDDSDFKNSGGREAHSIVGAVFLKQFVENKTPWAHLDIAGTATIDKNQPYCPKGATGFGVRLLVDFLSRFR